MPYKLLSLFDGSGGFPLAGSLCGIEPVAASEVEPYPIAVTRSRFPGMKHLGDISKINGAEIEPVNVITFGSPCQDLSVAGKRAGIKHEATGDEETTRSGLFMEAVRIIKEMRRATNGLYPNVVLWETVPGAFSSNGGEDFRTVLDELIKIVEPDTIMPPVPKAGWAYSDSYCGDGWSLAYRVFDAQYWGVPQRRRRIHLVLHLTGGSARKILFEREGVRGYFAEGRAPWQTTPRNAENCPGTADCKRDGVIAVDQGGGKSGANFHFDVSPTLTCTHGGEPAVAYVYDARGNGDGQRVATITGDHENRITDYTTVVCEPKHFAMQAFGKYTESEIASTMKYRDYKNATDLIVERNNSAVCVLYIVRRLTPIECQRLQGFADAWGVPDQKDTLTDEEYRFWLDVRNTHAAINGKSVKEYTREQMLKWYNNLHAESAEYKMWGNGIALPPALYCMQGIVDALEENEI